MNCAYLGNNRAVVKTLLGSKIFVSTLDRQIAPHLMLDGEWEAWMTRAIHPYLKGSVFFDIGANYGWYCLVAKHAGARKIFAFEPNLEIFELLEDTMDLNGIEAIISACGVGDEPKTRMFYPESERPGGASFLAFDVDNPYEVRIERLDDVAEAIFKEEPELERAPVVLKIDVEGFEPKVVLGAAKLLSRKTPSVTAFVEHHHDPENRHGFSDMLDFFDEQGFTLNLVEHDDSIVKITREQLNEVPDAEMLCFRRISA